MHPLKGHKVDRFSIVCGSLNEWIMNETFSHTLQKFMVKFSFLQLTLRSHSDDCVAFNYDKLTPKKTHYCQPVRSLLTHYLQYLMSGLLGPKTS